MASLETLSKLLGNENIVPGSSKKPGEYFMKCPFCELRGYGPDKGHRLGFNIYTGVYHCFRCRATQKTNGAFNKLEELALLSNQNENDYLENDLTPIRERVNRLFLKPKIKQYNLDDVSLPLTEEDTPFAYSYLANRGFTDRDIIKYTLRVGKVYFDENLGRDVKKWSGRIIFPFIEGGNVAYLIGRAYAGKEPKYLNSSGNRSYIVYGLDKVMGECILCEGIISSISAEKWTGIPSVATLSKTITKQQLSRIRTKCNKIWLSLDGDVLVDEKIPILKELLSLGFEVYNIDLPQDKDPDDLGEDYLTYFKEAKKVNRLSITKDLGGLYAY